MTDFTINAYKNLLRLAKKNYKFSTYDLIPWGERFILWRHDVDFSLNRSLRLARIENEESVAATYFINPHAEYYNLSEGTQFRILKEIISLGHDIGLHFDCAFHHISEAADLKAKISREASYLQDLLEVKIFAFSFHNPTLSHLQFDEEYYCGLLNCYSKKFKEEIPYCSDSNGIWRHRNLKEVLQQAEDQCLQVLTHPGWWQENAMFPRERVYRSVFGRAHAVMEYSDLSVSSFGRTHESGLSSHLLFLKTIDVNQYSLCDYLWNLRHYETLYLELWRILELQLNSALNSLLKIAWGIDFNQLIIFINDSKLLLDKFKLLGLLDPNSTILRVENFDYYNLLKVRNNILQGYPEVKTLNLELLCVSICTTLANLVALENQQITIDPKAIKSMNSVKNDNRWQTILINL